MEKVKNFLKHYWFDTKRGLIWLVVLALLGGGISYLTREKPALKECKLECVSRATSEYVSPLTVWEHRPTAVSLPGEGYFPTQKECLDYCLELKTNPKKLEEFKEKKELESKKQIKINLWPENDIESQRKRALDYCKTKSNLKDPFACQFTGFDWFYPPTVKRFKTQEDCIKHCAEQELKELGF